MRDRGLVGYRNEKKHEEQLATVAGDAAQSLIALRIASKPNPLAPFSRGRNPLICHQSLGKSRARFARCI